MKAEHHAELFKSRSAGPVTISRPNKKGELVVVKIVEAGTVETARFDGDSKRGPKPGQTKSGAAAEKFAESANSWE
jgi:hypothetical protein